MHAARPSNYGMIQPGDDWQALVERAVAACTRPARWRIVAAEGSGWIELQPVSSRTPAQGWKLHLAASVVAATELLNRALPLLLAEDSHFKLVATSAQLQTLNNGEGGHSQIGKFITIYPNNDQQAVRLAVALDRATAGLRGPAIPSDRPLRPGSLVFYRYGAFSYRWVQSNRGQMLPALQAPDGTLVPDTRSAGRRPGAAIRSSRRASRPNSQRRRRCWRDAT